MLLRGASMTDNNVFNVAFVSAQYFCYLNVAKWKVIHVTSLHYFIYFFSFFFLVL